LPGRLPFARGFRVFAGADVSSRARARTVPSQGCNAIAQLLIARRRNDATVQVLSHCKMAARLGSGASMTVNGSKQLRVLVVDGDDIGRRKLRLLLESLERLERVEDAASAPQAAAKLGEIAPDLVVLDLDLPGTAGIGMLRAADAPCIIVTTAYPEQSLRTLDLDTVDCLVKPVERERLAVALRHARRRLAERRIAGLALEIAGAAAAFRDPALPGAHGASCYADQMTIRVRRRMFALAVADIAWIEGASQYSRVHAKGGEFLLSRSLSSLESELDPARFFRIHRSAIVNADYVREVMSRGDGRYNVYLQGGEALSLGRGRREVLRRLLSSLKAGGDSPLFPQSRKKVTVPKKSGGPKAAASG